MSMLSGTKNSTITIWKVNGHDSVGEKTFDSPITASARYVRANEVFYDETGSSRRGQATVYADEADVGEVNIGDVLIDGDKSGTSDPKDLVDAFNIGSVKLSVDFNQQDKIYRLTLV